MHINFVNKSFFTDRWTSDKIVDAGLLLLKIKYDRDDVIFFPPSTLSIIGSPGNPVQGAQFVTIMPRYLNDIY